jgi:hypothetical protein
MRLRSEEKEVLRALVSGYQLKSHRSMDGEKVYTLHDTATDATKPVLVATVDRLRDLGLIASNMKFPAATYLLTAEGERVAASLTASPLRPLLARLFRGGQS